MKKKLLSLILAGAMLLSLGACSSEQAPAEKPAETPAAPVETPAAPATPAAPTETPAAPEAKGEVYYLNFKPEQDEAWQALAKAYTDETGVPVTIVTAASNTYEETLMSEMAKSNPPTMFHVNGPIGLLNWSDYCLDLSGSDLYGELTSDGYALKNGDEVKAMAMAIESYGIIVNKTLLAEAGYSIEDITNFESLKAIAEDITARSSELGFAAFSSAGMDGSSNWRFQTHLANLPIYYEYEADGINSTEAIKGTYLDNYKNIFDLYINNSTCAPAELSAKTGDDSRNEFLNKQAVFFQNGSWEYANLVGEGLFTDDDLAMIPIYIGVEGEENQGICAGTENYWCVNSQASEDNIKATLDFMYWCVTSETGLNGMCVDMGFVLPFAKGLEATNLFMRQNDEMAKAGKTPVRWDFPTIPGQTWKDNLATALTAYTAGTGDWDGVVSSFVDGWASEYAAMA